MPENTKPAAAESLEAKLKQIVMNAKPLCSVKDTTKRVLIGSLTDGERITEKISTEEIAYAFITLDDILEVLQAHFPEAE